jgi:hypothetical protein
VDPDAVSGSGLHHPWRGLRANREDLSGERDLTGHGDVWTWIVLYEAHALNKLIMNRVPDYIGLVLKSRCIY